MSPTSSAGDLRDEVATTLRAAGCVFAETEADLLLSAASTTEALDDMVDRRVAGHPLEHVLGWAAFGDLRIVVGPGVFVPRPRTELLARQGVAAVHSARAAATSDRIVVVDLCCGSGAVGALLLAACPAIELHAVDIDADAVTCARRNVGDRGGRTHLGDLFQPLPSALRGLVRVVVANTPYVPSDEVAMLPAEARLHEPRAALDGGDDGLDIVRRVLAEAPEWLSPGGQVLVETGRRQAAYAVALAEDAGLRASVVRDAELDATVVSGTLPD